MKSLLALILLLYYSTSVIANPCKRYSDCRMELLSRRFSCLEEPRRAVEQSCKLKEDLRLVWKASLWKERWMTQCLLAGGSSWSSSCFQSPPINADFLRKCGLSLRLLEERCDLLKNCCDAAESCLSASQEENASKELEARLRAADEKAGYCNKRIYSAIQNLTEEDVMIGRSIIKRTAMIRELLVTLTDTPVPIATVSSIPLAAYKNKTIKGQLLVQPVIKVDSESRNHREIRRNPQQKFVKVQTADFETTGTSRQKKSRAFSPSFFGRPLYRRKAKTLFVHLLNAKRKGKMKPWRDARIRSVTGLGARRLNGNRKIISTFSVPISGTTKEDIWKSRIDEIKKKRLFYKKKKIVETTLKPVYLAMRFVDRKTGLAKKDYHNREKSASEEDFDAEFEQKAGSLVSFGPNALPLPGSKKFSPVDDPFENIVVKKELNTADVTDISTLSPLPRPRQVLVPLGRGYAFTTPAPLQFTTHSLWDPLLSFFSTPAPFYFRTPLPVRIWPFKKVAHGVKNTNQTESNDAEGQPEEGATAVSLIVDGSSTEKGYCIRYRTCLRILEKTEKECDRDVKRKRTETRRESVCLNLDKRFQITTLVKQIEDGYRQCVLEDTEGHNKGQEGCSVLPPLPDSFHSSKTCEAKITELRRHCGKSSRCCTTTERCQTVSASSEAFAKLKLAQKGMETMRHRCHHKENDFLRKKTTTIVERVARLDANNDDKMIQRE